MRVLTSRVDSPIVPSLHLGHSTAVAGLFSPIRSVGAGVRRLVPGISIAMVLTYKFRVRKHANECLSLCVLQLPLFGHDVRALWSLTDAGSVRGVFVSSYGYHSAETPQTNLRTL